MVVRARHKAANSIHVYCSTSRSHIWPWGFTLRLVLSPRRPVWRRREGGGRRAASRFRCGSRHQVGGGGATLTSLTWMFLPRFNPFFCFGSLLPASSCSFPVCYFATNNPIFSSDFLYTGGRTKKPEEDGDEMLVKNEQFLLRVRRVITTRVQSCPENQDVFFCTLTSGLFRKYFSQEI